MVRANVRATLNGSSFIMTPTCEGPPPRMGTFTATSVLTIQEPGPAGMAIQYLSLIHISEPTRPY